MLICDRCLKNHSNIRCHCFGQAGANYPGLAHYDLCPDCAKEFAERFEQFVSHTENEISNDR